MAKMKALQPEMQRLKDLYKDDKQKIQMETMNLYKRKGKQLVAAFQFNTITILLCNLQSVICNLRDEACSFFGWIQDLSAPDPTTIFNLFGLIPWDPPSFLIIGIWPILMD